MVVTDATASPVRFPDETIEIICMDNLYLYCQYGDENGGLYTLELSVNIPVSYYLFKIGNV